MADALPTELHPITRKVGFEPTTFCLELKIAELILKTKKPRHWLWLTSGGCYANNSRGMKMERVIGIEPTTITLATWRSTS